MSTTEAAPTTITGWHFASNKLRDDRPLPKKGDVLRHEGGVVPCERGLHGSIRALDALRYAPGSFVARIELSGEIVAHNGDKHAASERRYLTGYVDVTNTLHRFACWVATKALDREEAAGWKVDPRSRAAIEAKLAWLDGEIDEATLAAAAAAAKAGARDTAWDAERAAARDAAWAVAWATRGHPASWAADRATAWATRERAERDEYNARLEAMLTELLVAAGASEAAEKEEGK